MKTLAELSFDYIWLLLFSDEDILDFDYSVKMQESLSSYFESMLEAEKEALSQVAAQAKARLLAEPDRHGYTPRKLVTEDQKVFLDAVISGELFG